jgi:hypothetical protein
LRSAASYPRLSVRIGDPALSDVAQSSSLLTTAPSPQSALSAPKARPPSLVDSPSAKIPKQPNYVMLAGSGEVNYGQMIAI